MRRDWTDLEEEQAMYIVKKIGRKTFQVAQITHERFFDCRLMSVRLWNFKDGGT